MKTIPIVLLLVALKTFYKPADLGVPTIQAVCKVTMINGTSKEGFISFGFGGFFYKYRPDGFCYLYEDGSREFIPYNFKFRLIDANNLNQKRKGKLYYIKNLSQSYIEAPKAKYDEQSKILTLTKTEVEKYQFFEEMVLYTKIPLDLHVGEDADEENGAITIKVNQIRSVELLREPSKRAIELIKKAREKQRKMNEEEEWVDYQEPVWYHEIINNKEMVKYLSQFF